MIHRQTSFDSVVLTKNNGLVRSFPINGDQLKAEKKKLNWPMPRYFLEADKSWIDYRPTLWAVRQMQQHTFHYENHNCLSAFSSCMV